MNKVEPGNLGVPDQQGWKKPHKRLSERALYQLTLVRFREFWREPEAVFWVFIFPIMLAAGLGVAFQNRPADALRIGTTNEALARSFSHEKLLRVEVASPGVLNRELIAGRIVLIVLPGTGAEVVYRYDDTNPDARLARLLAERAMERAAGLRTGAPSRDDVVREPGSRYIDFLVPGLLGLNLMGSGIWSIGFAIVDARRKMLLKRLIASPMSRAEYLLSFLFSRLAVLSIEVLALIGFAVLVFGVPVRGQIWELAVLCLLTSLAFSALGLLLASRARTIEAVSGLMNFVMLPMWVFSGVFFSAERFPDVLQPFIQALPLTAAINVLRAHMLEGATLTQIGPELAVLLCWLVVSFALAMKIFRWR